MKQENGNRLDQGARDASIGLPRVQSSLLSAHLGVTQRTLRHVDVIAQHLQHHSILLDLVSIQLYQQLIKIYGAELDQQITSDTILTDIKNLVEAQFEKHNLWQTSAKEIWSSLVLRTIEDMQRDLGNTILESLDWEAFNRILFQYLFNSQAETIDHRIRHLEEFYAQTIASHIVADLNLSRQPVLVLKHLLGLRSKAIPQEATGVEPPRLQRSPIAEIPSEFPSLPREDTTGQLSFIDQLQADLWESDARSAAYLRYHARHHSNHYLEHYLASPGDLEMLPWEAAEQILRKFGINAVKLHFILAAHTMQQAAPWQNTFSLRVSDTIATMGWQQSANALHQLASLGYALSCLLVKFVCMEEQAEAKAISNGTAIHTPLSKLWDILIAPQGDFDWTTGRIETPEEVQLTVRSGLWVTFFQESVGLTEALSQFGQLALHLLQLDAYSHDLTLRLVIHLMLDTRIRASNSDPYTYQVKTLLETVLSEAIVQEAQTSMDKGQSLFASWSQSLSLLSQLGWCIEGNGPKANADLENGLGFYISPYPKWLDPAQNVRKPRGWVNTWLEQKLMFKPVAK